MAEYIKRAEAMKICEEYSRHCFENNDSYEQDLAEKIEDDIIKIPTADVVEVKHGKWERREDGIFYWYECSECSEHPPYDKYHNMWLSEYCPHCGAKMDGKDTNVPTK